jgi:hypothetical protein
LEELITSAKRSTKANLRHLLHTFSFVPEDKVNWSPSTTAKSALRIVAHCAVSNGAFAAIIDGEPMTAETFPEIKAKLNEEEKKLATKEAAIDALNGSYTVVISALDRMTPEKAASYVVTPFLKAPMPFFMNLPGMHMGNHAAQIAYLQTCWGDLDPHFG